MKRFEFGISRTYLLTLGVEAGLWFIDFNFIFFSVGFTYNTKENLEHLESIRVMIDKMDQE